MVGKGALMRARGPVANSEAPGRPRGAPEAERTLGGAGGVEQLVERPGRGS